MPKYRGSRRTQAKEKKSRENSNGRAKKQYLSAIEVLETRQKVLLEWRKESERRKEGKQNVRQLFLPISSGKAKLTENRLPTNRDLPLRLTRATILPQT